MLFHILSLLFVSVFCGFQSRQAQHGTLFFPVILHLLLLAVARGFWSVQIGTGNVHAEGHAEGAAAGECLAVCCLSYVALLVHLSSAQLPWLADKAL